MKIVVNRCFGGFSLSHDAIMNYAKLAGIKLYTLVDISDRTTLMSGKYKIYKKGDKIPHFGFTYSTKPLNKDGTYKKGSYWYNRDIERNDPYLVKAVEKLGAKANGQFAQLEVVEIPDGVEWEIDEYDGLESIHEAHRSW